MYDKNPSKYDKVLVKSRMLNWREENIKLITTMTSHIKCHITAQELISNKSEIKTLFQIKGGKCEQN